MFSRLLIVFLAVVLVSVTVVSVLSYLNLRANAIDNRMNALKTQARDMAYLASRKSYDVFSHLSGLDSTTDDYMEWKSSRIYKEYNAYIMVVDRSGKNYLFYNESTLQDDSLTAVPTQEEISAYMDQALRGEEVVRLTQSASGPLFTVLVPWVQENGLTGQRTVMGFILIQTAAQVVHASYRGMLLRPWACSCWRPWPCSGSPARSPGPSPPWPRRRAAWPGAYLTSARRRRAPGK